MTNAEARFNNSLRPRKPEGLLGRTAQDVHLDSHTAPELWSIALSLTLTPKYYFLGATAVIFLAYSAVTYWSCFVIHKLLTFKTLEKYEIITEARDIYLYLV